MDPRCTTIFAGFPHPLLLLTMHHKGRALCGFSRRASGTLDHKMYTLSFHPNGCPVSAKLTITGPAGDEQFCPKPDLPAALFDHLIGEGEKRWRDCDAKRL